MNFLSLIRLGRNPTALLGGLILAAALFAFMSFAAKGDPRAYYNSFINQYQRLDTFRSETLLRAWDPQNPGKLKSALSEAHQELEKAKTDAKELYAPPNTESGDFHKAYLKYLDDYQELLIKLDKVASGPANTNAYTQWSNLLTRGANSSLDQFDARCEAFVRTHFPH